uniref:Nudix hydrolase domain-containing protein n=1 Tax=Salix viminalis TaxID=40686 RepID=A0A6N2L7D8_SALVM
MPYRIAHPDIELENSISEIWDQRVQKNASMFNGKKFRYGGHTLCKRDGSQQDFHVCLHLGLTDYRTFVGTNLNPLWEKFLVPSEDDLIQCQHTSCPLGNGAILETSDKKIVVLQRSYNVGEFPGHVVFPGGHPEPEEVGAASHQMGERLTNSEHNNSKVSQEMFDSIIREVVEEIGVPVTSLSNPLFIGISRRVLNVRPAAFFFIKCNIESKEIQRLYAGAKDGYESTQLYTVSLIELENMASKMPGCHQGGFALYKLMLEAMKNI